MDMKKSEVQGKEPLFASMAPTLTSNSFLLTSTPNPSRATNLKNPRLSAFAKRAGPLPAFRFGKSGDGGSVSDEGQADDSANSSPFRFNFGKMPDVKALVPVVSRPSFGLSFGNQRAKDPGTVFVAGATGQAGVRIAQTLLREGFSVRAGVPELGAAQELARVASKYKIISNEESKRLNAVESVFQDAESIAKAIGNASKVVVTIGPAENGPTTEVTPFDALQVIQAAQLAGVGHVVIIYDGNAAGSSTNNVLDGISSFFNNLFSQTQLLTVAEFLQKVIEMDVSYTFIKTSLTEDFSPESSYNIVVSAEGSGGANDYKVAKSQIAALVADVFSNTSMAENKVVEVYTDPSAPMRPVDQLFGTIPEDGRRKVYAEMIVKAKAEEEATIAAERARRAAEATKKLEEVKKLTEQEARTSSLAEDAQVKADAAGASINSLLNKAKNIGTGMSWEKFSTQVADTVQKSIETPKPEVQIATVRGQTKARTLSPQKAVSKPVSTPKPASLKPKEQPKPKAKQTDAKTEVRKVFGGLFTQETVYVDDE